MTAYVQLATEMEDLGLVPDGEARVRAQAYANESRLTVWVRDEFSDEPIYSVEPAAMPTCGRTPIDLIAEAIKRGVSTSDFAEIARRCKGDRESIWTVLQGF